MMEKDCMSENNLKIQELLREFGIFLDMYNQYMDENKSHPKLHKELEEILRKLQKALEKI